MPTIVTKTFFCSRCFQAGRPHSMHPFIVHGSSHNDYLVKLAQGNGIPGFTPHILKIHQATPSHIVYDMFCGVCGVTIIEVDGYVDCWDFNITKHTWKRDIIPVAQWNQWMRFKDFSYYI